MSSVILKVENVSKQYRLGTFGTKTIGGDFQRWWTTKIRGKEDPFLTVGSINDRSSKEKTDFVWALKNIDFEVKRGEVLGIIGKNGAGKSTLLKLLSRITTPTTGMIQSWGRMASLLEVGTGFHPELTGRENIFLNGAILGMTKPEIKRKLDAIIDFSGCDLYIDTPVKRYSSGMTVRLGFAVAAFLDPEILIVDEVLAVGDAEFQKKAIGKMQDISRGEGRTVLFVSHNMESINQLCTAGLLIENGQLGYSSDNILEVTNRYLNLDYDEVSIIWQKKTNTLKSKYYDPTKLYLLNDGKVLGESTINRGQKLQVVIEFVVYELDKELEINFALENNNKVVFVTQHTDTAESNWPQIKKGNNRLVFELDTKTLNLGEFELKNSAFRYKKEVLLGDNDLNQPKIKFKLTGVLSDSPYWQTIRPGGIAPIIPWQNA